MKKTKKIIITKSVGLYLNLLSYFNVDKATSIAYQFFSQPRKGRFKNNRLPDFLQNSIHDTLGYNGEQFQTYIWQGDEKVILLVHGWESNASRWKKLLQHLLPAGHTIIAIDAPAHGLSDGIEFNAPKYAEFIHVLVQKYQPKIFIGHSFGGATIAYYLYKFKNPDVEKVILLGAPSDLKMLSDQFVSLLSLNKKIKIRLEKYCLEKFNISIDDFSGHKFATDFLQKAIIAHDSKDKIVPVTEGRKYASTWKNAIYLETNGLGHSMHDNNLYQKLVAFITKP